MVTRIANNFKVRHRPRQNPNQSFGEILKDNKLLPINAKFLAWGIFLIFFIENGTLGLLPKEFYFVYRNIRVSDFLLYGLTLYALFNVREFAELYKSKDIILVKILILYLIIQFVSSTILYQQNLLEYFFRLKGVWMSLLIFPYLLLLKRNALPFLIRLILPVAIVSNILYILSALTGVAFLPNIDVVKSTLPGGLKVYRVFGGTFYGELFFLGYIYLWITGKFKVHQVFLAILFITPHILAFGRSAWLFFAFTIFVLLVWNSMKNQGVKVILKQAAIVIIFGIIFIYVFLKFIPESDSVTEAISARVEQGQDDFQFKEGTYGTRLANIDALLGLWQRSSILFGIGMHPMWVIKPMTVEENIYAWGFSDVRWASILAAYGIIGFILAILFQVYYTYKSIFVLRKSDNNSIYTLFILVLLATLLFDSTFNYAYNLFTLRLWGLSDSFAMFLAVLTYKSTYLDA